MSAIINLGQIESNSTKTDVAVINTKKRSRIVTPRIIGIIGLFALLLGFSSCLVLGPRRWGDNGWHRDWNNEHQFHDRRFSYESPSLILQKGL
jgi:hypothetical protein